MALLSYVTIAAMEYINQLLIFRSDPSLHPEYELAVALLKPDFTPEHEDILLSKAAENYLQVIKHIDIILTIDQVIAIYNDIFRFSNNDIMFGIEWKKRKLHYMASDTSRIYLLQGKNAQQICEQIKYEIREQFKKLSVPNRKLNDEKFEELAIKNIIHVVDKDETDIPIWLFFN
jgi:hypothetical protein